MVKLKISIEKFIIDTVRMHTLQGSTYFVKTIDLFEMGHRFKNVLDYLR